MLAVVASLYFDYVVFCRGKFAIVKRCTEKSTGQQFAAKVLKKRRRGKSCREDILMEIDIMRQAMEHQRIIKLHEVFESSTEFHIIIELWVRVSEWVSEWVSERWTSWVQWSPNWFANCAWNGMPLCELTALDLVGLTGVVWKCYCTYITRRYTMTSRSPRWFFNGKSLQGAYSWYVWSARCLVVLGFPLESHSAHVLLDWNLLWETGLQRFSVCHQLSIQCLSHCIPHIMLLGRAEENMGKMTWKDSWKLAVVVLEALWLILAVIKTVYSWLQLEITFPKQLFWKQWLALARSNSLV